MQTYHPLSQPQEGAREKQKPNKKALLFLSLFFIAMLVAVYVRSPLSKLQTITIEGNHQISDTVIESKSGLSKEMNVWKIRTHGIEQTLLHDFPLFSQVTVHFQFPNSVIVTVKEKPTAALFMANGKFYHMLSDGTLLDEVPISYGTNLPIVTSDKTTEVKLGQPVKSSDVILLATELSKISPDLLSLFSDIEVRSDDEWVAHTLDGFEVRFDKGHLVDKLSIFKDFHKQLVESGHRPGIMNLMGRPVYSPYPNSNAITTQTVKPTTAKGDSP